MTHYSFRQKFFTKASLKSKSKWANKQEISSIKNIAPFCYSFLVLYGNLEHEKYNNSKQNKNFVEVT